MVNFLMDFGLLICFVLILKPLALVLIYLELFSRMLVAIGWLVTSEILLLFVPIVLTAIGIFDGGLPVALKPKSVAEFEYQLRQFHTETRTTRVQKITDKLLCIFSLSLLLRFLPGTFNRPSSVHLRKHDRLYKHSFLYRVCRHVI